MALRSSVISALLVVAACTPAQRPHHALVAPSPTAPEAERLAAHERLFARADAVSGIRGAMSTEYLILGDGTRVYHPEDLIPAVDAASPTARAAARSAAAAEAARRRQSKVDVAWYVATAGMLIGTSLLIAGVASDDGTTLATTGTGLIIGSGLGGVTAGWLLAGDLRERHVEAKEERVSAFATYNSDLVKRLELCEQGDDVVPCPAPAAPAASAASSSPDAAPAGTTNAAP